MARVIAALLLFFIGNAEAQAQSSERLIGLLDLPGIVAGGCGPAPKRATARAFGAPSQNRRRMRIDDREGGRRKRDDSDVGERLRNCGGNRPRVSHRSDAVGVVRVTGMLK